VYRITEGGAVHFDALLNATGGSDDARSFGLRWSFARHLAPTARLALLERRRAQLVQHLGDAAGTDGLDLYARSVVEHAQDGVNRDIAWLDELIAAERALLAGPSEHPLIHPIDDGARPSSQISPA
jgi:hypothetical protein